MKNIIANKIPSDPVGGKKSDVAASYGLTVKEFNVAMYDWLQCEGETPNGQMSLHEWLTCPHKGDS